MAHSADCRGLIGALCQLETDTGSGSGSGSRLKVVER